MLHLTGNAQNLQNFSIRYICSTSRRGAHAKVCSSFRNISSCRVSGSAARSILLDDLSAVGFPLDSSTCVRQPAITTVFLQHQAPNPESSARVAAPRHTATRQCGNDVKRRSPVFGSILAYGGRLSPTPRSGTPGSEWGKCSAPGRQPACPSELVAGRGKRSDAK